MNQSNLARRENANYRLVLYTTKGCEACHIAENIVKKVAIATSINYYVKEITKLKEDIELAKEKKIKDFPTLIMFRNTLDEDIEELRFEGTFPAFHIMSYINAKLNNLN